MNAVVVLLFGAVGGVVIYFLLKSARDRRAQDFERRVHARKLGWNYVGERDGRIDYRFSGSSDGVAWSMWYDSDRGDKSPTPKAIWKTANLRTPGLSLVIIGTSRFQRESGAIGRLVLGVISGITQSMSDAEAPVDKAQFYESAVVLEGAQPSFREQLTAAVAPDMPRGWLDVDLQSRLLRWPRVNGRDYDVAADVEVTLRADGLQIVAERMPQDIAAWRHLTELGQMLANRLAAHASGSDA